MKPFLLYLKALYTWTKWTIQSLFLPKDRLTDDIREGLADLDAGRTVSANEIEADLRNRPGSDDQFHEWNTSDGLATDAAKLREDQRKIARDFGKVVESDD